MRTAEVELHHRQPAVLDGAADVDPALHRLAAGAADQMRALVLGVRVQLLEMGNPFRDRRGRVARAAVEAEVVRDLAVDDVVLLVEDRVLGVLGEDGHVLDVGQRLDDHAAGAGVDAFADHLGAVGRLERRDDHRVLEVDAAEFSCEVGHGSSSARGEGSRFRIAT